MRRGVTAYHPFEFNYIRLLSEAQAEPDAKSMPACHEHIEALAQSIHRRKLTDAVIVLVDPGIREPDLFSCFLCHKDGKQDEQTASGSYLARSGTIGGDPG